MAGSRNQGYHKHKNAQSFNHNDKEYQERRKRDNERVALLEKFMDEVYAKEGYEIQRVTETSLQKKGVDFIHMEGSEKHRVDEKYAINYYNKDLFTFSFEVYSKNNANCDGWFVSENMITDDYAILWFRANEDFSEITKYDLCVVPKKAIWDLVYDAGFDDELVHDFLRYWDYIHILRPDDNYYERGEGKGLRRYYDLDYGIKLCQSVGFSEQPINLIIPKEELVRIATHRFKSPNPKYRKNKR